MSEYSDDGFDMDSAMDDKPVSQKPVGKEKKPATAPVKDKKVNFKVGGKIDKFEDIAGESAKTESV